MKFKMKKFSKYILMPMAAMMAVLTSCSDDLAQPPVVTPESGIGTGAWDNPFTASQARLGSMNYQINPAWVKGYIVGCIDTEQSTVLNLNSADFIPPFGIDTNMLIADDPEPFKKLIELYETGETDAYDAMLDSLVEVVAPVQLPSNLRSQLSPNSNPSMLHVQVCLQGTTGETYCGEYGVRSPIAYTLGDMGVEPGEDPAPEAVGKFYQNFTAATTMSALETQGWRNQPTEGNLVGWKVVVADDNNYIATDAFLGFANGGPYEHWLMTPPIIVSELAEKTLEFESAAANPAPGTTIELFALSSDNPDEAQMIPLAANFAAAPASGYSPWMSSGRISLEGLADGTVIAWRYRAQKGGYGNSVTYCIDNVNVGNCPIPADWTKASEFYAALSMNDTNGADGWTFDNVLLTGGISRVWQWKEYNSAFYLNGSAYYNSKNNPSLSYAYSQPVDLTGYRHVGLSFDHAASFQTTIPQLGRVVVREAGTEEWTEFIIPAWPISGKWVFSTSGIIDISEFAGKVVELGFKYESNENGADTWEIRDLKLIGIEE